jgi:hypothetical protein
MWILIIEIPLTVSEIPLTVSEIPLRVSGIPLPLLSRISLTRSGISMSAVVASK